jgi:hypothetical protein
MSAGRQVEPGVGVGLDSLRQSQHPGERTAGQAGLASAAGVG